jgi:predicted MFS family arabinose efflux permease
MTITSPDTETHGPVGDEATASADRLVRGLSLAVFLQWFGASAIIPMLPEYIRHRGGTDSLAGLVMAAFFAAGVLSQYPAGRIADRVGRRPVLVAGLVIYAVASFGFLAPVSPATDIGLRALQGSVRVPPKSRRWPWCRRRWSPSGGGRRSPPSTRVRWPAWPSGPSSAAFSGST